MSDDTLEALRYPIGRFRPVPRPDAARRAALIDAIEALPDRVEAAVAGLDGAQLDTAYREGGWTLRQVVHHLADSHLNATVRFRLALTEERPTVKTYDEAAWARLPDALSGPVETSLMLLRALHARWVDLLRAQPASAFERALVHPERGPITLDFLLDLYAWHCRHHVAHITGTRERHGW